MGKIARTDGERDLTTLRHEQGIKLGGMSFNAALNARDASRSGNEYLHKASRRNVWMGRLNDCRNQVTDTVPRLSCDLVSR